MKALSAWTARDPHRARLVRWSAYFVLGWMLEIGLAMGLGRLGLLAQLLSAGGIVAALAGLLLLTLRVVRVVVLPPAIAFALTLALWPRRLGARGDGSQGAADVSPPAP